MKIHNNLLIVISLFFVFSTISFASNWDSIYKKHSKNGTTVLMNLETNEVKVHNPSRTDTAFLPASTFKIFNSMAALQEGAVENIYDTIRWDGQKRFLDSWNQDQTMKDAMPRSCVWFYQELARRIGMKKMQYWLDEVGYGNATIGTKVDDFWLQGNIRISAKEQVEFIKRLINNDLPFDKDVQKIVKEIMITDSTDKYVVHSKTGWAMRIERQIGWYVGYIETEKGTWIFATNIDIDEQADLRYRQLITYQILMEERIIEKNEK
jgi:beta-lactamase class D